MYSYINVFLAGTWMYSGYINVFREHSWDMNIFLVHKLHKCIPGTCMYSWYINVFLVQKSILGTYIYSWYRWMYSGQMNVFRVHSLIVTCQEIFPGFIWGEISMGWTLFRFSGRILIKFNLCNKDLRSYRYVCMLAIAGQTSGPNGLKLFSGTHG